MTDEIERRSDPDNQKKKKKIKKRSREEVQNDQALASFKKLQVDLTDLAPDNNNSSSNDHSSTTTTSPVDEAGVFDFPWMKEEGAAMKFDDDAFASSLDVVSEIFGSDDDDRLIVTGKCGVERDCRESGHVMRRKVEEEEEEDGLECVWNSLLNQQPLSNIDGGDWLM